MEGTNRDQVEENLILSDIDVREVNQNDDGTVEVLVEPSFFGPARDVLNGMGVEEFEVAEVTFLPNDPLKIEDPEDARKYRELADMLDELQDVQNVYTNIED